MLAKEWAHHMRNVALVASRHHRRETAAGRRAIGGKIERKKGKQRRSLEIARHQEAAGSERRHGGVMARRSEIVRKQARASKCHLFVLGSAGLERVDETEPVTSDHDALRSPGARQRIR